MSGTWNVEIQSSSVLTQLKHLDKESPFIADAFVTDFESSLASCTKVDIRMLHKRNATIINLSSFSDSGK